MNLPQARSSELVVQELGKELLVYDLKTHQAYTLNETSMIVFNACNGVTTFEQLSRQYKFSEDLVYLTLDRLRDENLIEDYQSKFAGISRREVIKRVGLASMVALPIISSLIAPTAAQAATSACSSHPNCICLLSNAPSNGTSCGNGDANTCNIGCTCTRNTNIGGCSAVGAMLFCPGVCS